MLCQILHPNVNGGHHIRSVNRIQHGDVHILIQNFPAMHQTVGSTEDGIVGEFQAILGTILGSKHISDGALGQRSERSAARVELFPMEAAPVFRQREEGKTLHFAERIVVDASVPNGEVQGTDSTNLLTTYLTHNHLVVAFRQSKLELFCRTIWEYLVQTLAEAVELLHPQRVLLPNPRRVVSSCLEVEVYLILRNAAGHKLSVTTEDIAATRLHAHTVTLQTGSHISPILFLGSHDIHGLANNGNTYHCHDYRDGEVAGHHFIGSELAHICIPTLVY